MHCHCDTNNRASTTSTFTDPCKPEVRPGAREESASPAWLAALATNARDTTKVYTWRPDTGCGPTLYRKCYSHNTPGKRHNNTWVKPSRGTILPAPQQREQVWQKCKIQKNRCTVTVAPTIEHHLDIHGSLQTRGETRCPGGVSVSCLASRARHECPRHNESVYMEAFDVSNIKFKKKLVKADMKSYKPNNSSKPMQMRSTMTYT